MNKVIVNFGGGTALLRHTQKGGQALGTCPPMTESKRGGQRHRLTIGGDSYGC